MKKVSIIIVSHNNKDILPRNLNALKKQSFKDFDIYLVDNDSNDGTKEFVIENYPKVKFISSVANNSKKRNLVLSRTNSKYIVTLDSDAILPREWIKSAVKYMDEHRDVGICGGKLLTEDGLIDFAGGVTAKNGGSADIGKGEKDKTEYNNFKRVSFIKSAAMIIRGEMIKQIEGFDENYVIFYEDTDLGVRANLAGWKVVYNPNLIATHLSHFTINKISRKIIDYEYMSRRNRWLFLLKNFETKTILANFPNILITSTFGIVKKRPLATLKGYAWILANAGKIIESRKKVLKKRKISDKKLFDIISFPNTIRNKKDGFLAYYKRRLKNEAIKDLTFFITTKCNSRCKHCFYWKELNKREDLTLKEVEKIFSNFYNINSLLFSGGEPFIRKDLEKIIELAIKYTDVKDIRIPTNGIIDMTERFEKILKENPLTNFLIVCSLDGLEKEHDYIRGVKGSFRKTIKLIKRLKESRKKYPNFKDILVNTVITNYNYKSLPKLIDFVKELDVDHHGFDIIRGAHQGIFSVPNIDALKKVNKLIYKTSKYYSRKLPLAKRAFNNLKSKKILKTQTRVLEREKWGFECSAGKSDLVIESDGTARICELQPKIGSLLKNTPEELLRSEKAKKIFNQIKNHECDCTHICNLSMSLNHYFGKFL